MSNEASAFPLAWPRHRPRTPSSRRQTSKFNTKRDNGRYTETKDLTVADARERVQREVDALRAGYPVLSTNLETRLDGQPRSGQREPADPGVALYFRLKGKPIVLACDRYTTVAANIAAIAAHIQATRAIERHGVGTLEEAFAGFTALPPSGKSPWRAVLGFPPGQPVTRDMVQAKRREMAKLHHADAGGQGSRMAEINAAADDALREVGDG